MHNTFHETTTTAPSTTPAQPAVPRPAANRARRSLRSTAVSAGLLAGGLALAGCGSSDHDMSTMPAAGSTAGAAASAAGTPAPGAHNDADVAFATGMIPHHSQAVEMAGMAAARGTAGEVKDLAAKIKAGQGKEIAQLSGWLTGWGKPVPATDGNMAAEHGAGGHGGMVGMMSEQEMSQLGAASGKAFDTLWLQLMIKHHEGAVTMATSEQAQGANPAARQLAQTIATTQASEITEMKRLQASLS